MMDEEAIRAVVKRLGRRHPSGGQVIERAAVMAEGSDSGAILAWIASHDGCPESDVRRESQPGLHGDRPSAEREPGSAPPRRYVIPPGAIS